MTTEIQPLGSGLHALDGGLASPVWATRFWLTQAPYLAPGALHCRSRYGTRVWLERDDTQWTVHFECEAEPAEPDAAPLRAFGDPDLWQAEYVQVQLPVGEEGGCLHLSVSRAGQLLSERHDKQRDPIAGWSAAAEERPGGWRARISFPRAGFPGPLPLRLARWAPGEGITRWPLPFGSWWHVQAPDFLVIDENGVLHQNLDAEAEAFLAKRESGLPARTGTPDARKVPAGAWWREAAGFIDVPLVRHGDFLNHLRQRLGVLPSLAFEALPPPSMELCRGLLENRVYFGDATLDLGAEPDWDSDHGNAFVMIHATRFDFLADLVAAHRQSGDAAYGRAALALIESFLKGNDIRQSLTPGRYPVRWGSGIVVSHRLVCMVRTLFSLLPAGLVSEDAFVRVFAAVREAAEVLSPSLSRLYTKNHSVIIGDHMLQLSVLCAELKASGDIRDCYWEHLRRAMEVQFLPDGVQAELSTVYHFVCYMRLTEATDACERAGVAVPAEITAWRRRILSTGAKYLFPNGQVAAFNDGSMSGTVDAIGQADSSLRARVLADGPVLGADDAVAIAAGDETGRTTFSNALPYAGHYILRDGYAPNSMALAFDAGPFGLAHAHEDALSLMLVRYGKALLIDIGSGAYDPGVPMRRYSTSTESHSTICIDGAGQASRFFSRHWKRSSPWDGHHHFGPAVQFAHGEYALGYGEGGGIAVAHQRTVLFVNRAYVVLIDYLLGDGAHQVESHFAVAPLPYELTALGLRTSSGTGDVDIALVYPPRAGVSVACGQQEPFAGWMPRGEHGLAPHPRLTYTLTAQPMPCCLVTLLSPFEAETEIPVTRVRESVDGVEVEIVTGESRAVLTCRRAPLDIAFRHAGGIFRTVLRPDGTLEFAYD